jgi:hypothetical protein
MPTSLIRPNGHRSLQASSFAYLAVLAVRAALLAMIMTGGMLGAR